MGLALTTRCGTLRIPYAAKVQLGKFLVQVGRRLAEIYHMFEVCDSAGPVFALKEGSDTGMRECVYLRLVRSEDLKSAGKAQQRTWRARVGSSLKIHFDDEKIRSKCAGPSFCR